MLFSSGCALDIPLVGKESREGIYPAVKARLGLEAAFYKSDLGKKIKTTPVHPADAGFLAGKTATEPDDYDTDNLNIAPKAGIFGSIGTNNIRFFGGMLGRWNLLHYVDDYQEGFYEVKQQVSDTRPKSQGSLVFTQLKPGAFTAIPYVGVEGKIKNLIMEASVGFPYMEWEARSGHDRWGRWQAVQSDSWTGFGTRYTGSLGYELNKNSKIFFSVFYEQYKPDFVSEKGTVSGIGGFLGLIYNF